MYLDVVESRDQPTTTGICRRMAATKVGRKQKKILKLNTKTQAP